MNKQTMAKSKILKFNFSVKNVSLRTSPTLMTETKQIQKHFFFLQISSLKFVGLTFPTTFSGTVAILPYGTSWIDASDGWGVGLWSQRFLV